MASSLESLWVSGETDVEEVEYTDSGGISRRERIQPMPPPALEPKGLAAPDTRRLSVLTGGQHWANKGGEMLNDRLFDMDRLDKPDALYHEREKERVAKQVSLNRKGVQAAADTAAFEQRGDMYQGYNPVALTRKPRNLIPTRRGTHSFTVVGAERRASTDARPPTAEHDDPTKTGAHRDDASLRRSQVRAFKTAHRGEVHFAGHDETTRDNLLRASASAPVSQTLLSGYQSTHRQEMPDASSMQRRIVRMDEQTPAMPSDVPLGTADAWNAESQRLVPRDHTKVASMAQAAMVLGDRDSQTASQISRRNFAEAAAVAADLVLGRRMPMAARDAPVTQTTANTPAMASTLPTFRGYGPATGSDPRTQELVARPFAAAERAKDRRIDHSHHVARMVADHSTATPTSADAGALSRELRDVFVQSETIPVRAAGNLPATAGNVTLGHGDSTDLTSVLPRGRDDGVVATVRAIAGRLWRDDRTRARETPRRQVTEQVQSGTVPERSRDLVDDGSVMRRPVPLRSGATKPVVHGEHRLQSGRETPSRMPKAQFSAMMPTRPELSFNGSRLS